MISWQSKGGTHASLLVLMHKFMGRVMEQGEVSTLNAVQPIKSKQMIRDIFDYLMEQNPRDAVLFATGIYTGLRVSDILLLRVRDVRDKKEIHIREKKTGKEKRITLNRFLRKLYAEYTEGRKDYESLFHGEGQPLNKAISRQHAYRILNQAAKHMGIEDGIGTHTMRKTFGYHYYKKTKDVATLMQIFNHSHASITLRYIGITQDVISKVYEEIDLLS